MMPEIEGDPDCIYCHGEGLVREPDGYGCVQWTLCICVNEGKTDPFVDDLINSSGALE